MFPRSSVTTNTPYSKRPASQFKSSRQQFSACGACRMRRVRCDLKDISIASPSQSIACSNCKERGLKCVDEFAEIEAVKHLRRGRRLQQVEAIYGKVTDRGQNSVKPSSSIIPLLHPDLFSSPFWHSFCAQRTFLDDFPVRYLAHTRNMNPLDQEGRLISMLLVAWAASFGLDERGVEDTKSQNLRSMTSRRPGRENSPLITDTDDKARRARVNLMVKEILHFVDVYGIMRRPTWDGVKVLLLAWPLTEDTNELERSALYTSSLLHAQSLCAVSPPTEDNRCTHVHRYAHMYEGITAGLRGSQLILDDDDMHRFQSKTYADVYSPKLGHELPTPAFSPGARDHDHHIPDSLHEISHPISTLLLLSAICRKINDVLTGPKAALRLSSKIYLDSKAMREIWDGLHKCWDEFDALNRRHEGDAVVRRCSTRGKIIIFECHNVIREALAKYSRTTRSLAHDPVSPSNPPSSSMPTHQLHELSKLRCSHLLPTILIEMRAHLHEWDRQKSGLYHWDTGLIVRGCFFAGYLSATGALDAQDNLGLKREEADGFCIDSQEAVNICLAAFQEMRWTFAKSEERQASIQTLWNIYRAQQQRGQQELYHGPEHWQVFQPESYTESGSSVSASTSAPYPDTSKVYHLSTLPLDDINHRPTLPPLQLGLSSRHTYIDSAPTSSSTGESGVGWSYTPSPNATTVTSTSYQQYYPPPLSTPHSQTLAHSTPGPGSGYSLTDPLGHSMIPEDFHDWTVPHEYSH